MASEPSELLATRYLLRMSHVADDVVEKYVQETWIEFEGLLGDREWSSTEDVILRAAQSLWSGRRECGVGEACQERLADEHFRTILEAMALRRGTQISFLKTTAEPE